MVRIPETCRGRRAWHVPKALLGTWEAQPTPAAPTTGAKREGQLNDKESRLIERWESDWSIVTRSKAQAAPKRAKGPTPQHRPHRKPGAVRTTAYSWPTSLRTKASCGEEPGAGKPLAGICEGGAEQSVSLPRYC